MLSWSSLIFRTLWFSQQWLALEWANIQSEPCEIRLPREQTTSESLDPEDIKNTKSLYSKLERTRDDQNGTPTDTIRVVRLQPGDRGTPIHASLFTRPLKRDNEDVQDSKQMKYEALSYVWGDSATKRTILLGGQEFLVAANLEAALQQIRDTHKIRTLWVDAICINQDDIAERNSQVVLMHRIYSNSSKVLVWLGLDDGSTQTAVAFIESMKRNEHIRPCSYLEQFQGLICGSRLGTLCSIVARPWWERMWTLQEIILSREAEILCGRYRIPWKDLFETFSTIERHITGCCSNIQICSECRRKYFNFREHVGGLYQQQQKLRQSQGLNLFDLLPQYRYRLVTEPRDKVYALLSLVGSEQSSRFDPDYACSVEDLWTKTAVCNISWCRSLRSLNYAADVNAKPDEEIDAGTSAGAKPSSALPSWVTNWNYYSENPGMRTSLQTRYEMYDAARGIEWSGTFRGLTTEPYKNCTFSTHGILFDKVLHVGGLCEFKKLEDSYGMLRQWLHFAKLHLDSRQAYIAGGTFRNAFWRTLTADVVVTPAQGREIWYSRASDHHGQDFWAWWKIVIEGIVDIAPPSGINTLVANMTTAISRRRLFITERGYIGNGPAKTKLGDEVFILCGGKMPLVLRPDSKDTFLESASSDPRPLHRLVGDCYIHGIMDGEAASNFEGRSHAVRIK